MKVDAHIPGILHHGIRHVQIVNCTVVTELALFIGKINLCPGKYLNISCVVVVNMNYHCAEMSNILECKIHLQRPHGLVFPANPLITWKWRKCS